VTKLKQDLFAYYSSPGPMTDPREYGALFGGLPNGAVALAKVVQGLLMHVHWAERYGVILSEERQQEVQIRPVDQKLARILELDGRPLTEERWLERKLVGNCRDFAVLLCAMLRHQGVPARARCGFGAYFLPGHYEDHWVCECWAADQVRWILVDAQLDAFQQEQLAIQFDPLDVPRDQFVTGGRAWQMCRAGEADPHKFGIFDMHGLWFVRDNLVRDFLSLNKVEVLPWDGEWNFLEDGEEAAGEILDRLAALTLAGDEAIDEIRSLYEGDSRFYLPYKQQ